MSDIVKEIKTRSNIVSIIGEKIKLERKGGRYYGLCPFHQEKSPSFMVSEHNNLYHCFGCKASGDVIKFIMEYDHLDFIEAVKLLAIRLSINVDSFDFSPKLAQKSLDIMELMKDACQIYQHNLQGLEQRASRAYIKSRGLSDEQIKYFSIGYSKPDSSLVKELLQKNYSKDQLLESGITYLTEQDTLIDRFKGRVIFPIMDEKGLVIGFGGRALDDQQPKYLNSPETEFFKKREYLFNLDKAKESIRKNNNVFVLEGYMDVISLVNAGVTNSVAVLGTALSRDHLLKLWKYCDAPTVCFDGDRAGTSASHKVAELAFELLVTGKSLRFITLPSGMDPDDLVRNSDGMKLKEILANSLDLSEYTYNYKAVQFKTVSPNEIATLEKELMSIGAKIPDVILQKKYISFFKDKLWQINRKTFSKGKKDQQLAKPELNIIIDQKRILELNLLLVFINFAKILREDSQRYHDFMNLEFNDKELGQIKSDILDILESEGEIEIALQKYKKMLETSYKSNFLIDSLEYTTNDIANLWLLAVAKYQLFNLEKEYRDLILLQDEGSLSRAGLILVEMQKSTEEINRISDLLDI